MKNKMKKISKLNFKISKEIFSWEKISEGVINFFFNHSGAVFMLFFVLISLLSFLLVYRYIFSSVWDDAKKTEYLQQAKSGEFDFNASKFDRVISEIETREARYSEDRNWEYKNIFGIGK